MRTLEFRAADGTIVSLSGDDGIWAETAPEIRGHEWYYDVSRKPNATMQAREITISVKVSDTESLDRLVSLADADIESGAPGSLVADKEWECAAFLAKNNVQTVTPSFTTTQLTFIQCDQWHRDTLTSYQWQSSDGEGLDYPFDYPFDYQGYSLFATVSNDTARPCRAKIVMFGPVSNPYVLIGGNTVKADVSLASGERLEINALDEPKTATIIDINGNRTNAFGKLVRGTGRGGGMYPFEPIAPGKSQAIWQGFDWELTIREERSEPPWT